MFAKLLKSVFSQSSKLGLAIACALVVISCQARPVVQQPTINIVRPASLHPEQTIPQPQTEILLTVDGLIQNTNQGDRIVMDRQSIESLELVDYRLFDLFEKRSTTFRGVWLSDLLELWQVKPDAQKLVLTALNDYQIEIPISLALKYKILVALMQDGQYMQRNYRGPMMLVLPPIDEELELPIGDYWIWQLISIQVK